MDTELEKQLTILEQTVKKLKDALLDNNDFSRLYIHKKIEDGILEKVQDASEQQLNRLNYYKWIYYSNLNDNNNLKNEIKNRLRNSKLDSLL